jgi:nucleotide-binding universal stress UspA family protein
MGSHGKGFLKRLVLGSVVQEVLLHIDRPVLVVNCKEHPAYAAAPT